MSATPSVLAGPALWSAQAHMPSVLGRQLVIERGDGSYVYTADGRKLFDGTAGLWHANIGHSRAELAAAAFAQMNKLETYHIFARFVNDQAIALANDTDYGLAASAWTRDVFLAQRASREIHAGCVWINDHIPIISEMPHGGFGASGFGKDMSTYSFEDYTVVKHVMFDITGVAAKPWHRTVFTRPGT